MSGPPIITAEAMQHAVKHSKGKLECRVGSSPPPDKIVSEPPIFVVCHPRLFESLRVNTNHTHITPLRRHTSSSHAYKCIRTHIHGCNCTDIDWSECGVWGSSGGAASRRFQQNHIQLAAQEAALG